MAEEYALRCSLCGVTHEVEGTSMEELNAAKQGGSLYICEPCKRKVQYDSEQNLKY